MAVMTAPPFVQLPPPKMLLSAFPKSGTHLANRMLFGMFSRHGANKTNWAGTASWNTTWQIDDDFGTRLAAVKPGQFVKGHMGHHPMIESFLIKLGFGVLFVYRDMRDVAVSTAYHVTSTDKRFNHHRKELYQDLPDFEAVLLAVINGIDTLPGLFDRWPMFAGWMDSPHAQRIRFEEMKLNPQTVASRVYSYVMNLAGLQQRNNRARQVAIGRMVEQMTRTDQSPTLRNGNSGEWRAHFTPKVKAAFIAKGGGDWLIEYGYEAGKDW